MVGIEMRRWLALLAIAALIYGCTPAVYGKVQTQIEPKYSHHNSIVGDGVKINKNNNVPYGQIKKAANEDRSMGLGVPRDRTINPGTGSDMTAGGIVQIAELSGQILAGHHNTIILESDQVADMTWYFSGSMIQESYINGIIAGGHHNLIYLDSTQIGLFEGSGSTCASASYAGDLIQVTDLGGRVLGGHHNTIVIRSLQATEVN